MSQSGEYKKITFSGRRVIEAVPGMGNLFKKFLPKIMSSLFKTHNLAVCTGVITA